MLTPNLQASRKMKKTSVGEIPVDWSVRSLATLCRFVSGGTPDMSVAGNWEGNIPWFSAKDLKSFRLESSIDMINRNGAAARCKLVPAGTLLILVRGMTLNKDVPVCLTTRESAFNQDLKGLIPNDDMLADYLGYALVWQKGTLLAMVDQAGHGTGRIQTGLLKELPIPVPALSEQVAIANLLQHWDTAIARAQALIKAKLEFMRGLTQQLLTGQARFNASKGEKWGSYRLGELFTERVEIGRTDLPLVAITGQKGVVPRASLTKRDSSSEDKSKYLRITPGDIGYNTMRMWQGVAGLSKIEGIVSPAYTICIPSNQIDAQFAAYLFKTAPMIHSFHRNSQGLVDDTLSLKFHNFARIHVTIPALPEQKRIAAVLNTCDEEIKLLERQLKALKEQKRGLMQKLLTGEIRVKVNND